MLLPALSLVGMLGGVTPPPIPPYQAVATLGPVEVKGVQWVRRLPVVRCANWSVVDDTGTATLVGKPLVQHYIERITVSTPTSPSARLVTVSDDTTEIYQTILTGLTNDLVFRKAALHGRIGSALTVTVGDGGTTQSLVIMGYSTRTLTSYS